jgi:hypothetical protein
MTHNYSAMLETCHCRTNDFSKLVQQCILLNKYYSSSTTFSSDSFKDELITLSSSILTLHLLHMYVEYSAQTLFP